MPHYETLQFSSDFMDDLVSDNFTKAEQRRFVRALQLLDTDERHPSLRVHQLQGVRMGTWSASATDELRITFVRMANGRKRLTGCSRHYQR